MWFFTLSFLCQLSNLWLCSIIFFSLQGVHAQVIIDDHTCGSVYGDLQYALNEVGAIAKFAYKRQIGLRDGDLNPGNMRVTMNA